MKLFGSKDDQSPDENFDDETEAGFDEAGEGFDENAGGALSAPSREFAQGGGKSRKGVLLGLLAVLLLGGGGGVYYFMTMMDAPAPAARTVKMLPGAETAAATLESPSASAPAPVDVTSDVLGGNMPPMPAVPFDDAAPEDAGGFLAQAEGLGAPPTDDTAVPVPFAAVTPPAPVAGFDDADAFGNGLAGSGPAAVTPADDANAPDMPADVLADAFAPVTAPVTAPASVGGAPAEAETPANAAAPVREDLPMPRMLETPGAVATTSVGTAAASEEASNAEKAIVENAAVLDQLSAPAAATAADPVAAGRTVNEILGVGGASRGGQPAIIRPMPDSYVIVRKERESGALDTRLKQGRSALMQNRHMAALQMFNEMHQDFPRDTRVAMGRALALQKVGQHEQALDAYEDILANDPKNLEALTNMLGILKVQNPSLALEKLTELRAAYPYNPDIAAQLGVAHAGLQSYAEALKFFDIADALRPGNGYVLFNRAVTMDRMGHEEQAASLYRVILRMAAEGALKEPVPLDAVRNRLGAMR